VRVNESGVAILLIEQNVHRALDICTMAYVLNRGQVTFAGPPGELRDESVLAAAYFAPSAQAAAAGPGPEAERSGDGDSRVRPGPVV
jgi:branched-chain amino acid transport system ATP-binding protein